MRSSAALCFGAGLVLLAACTSIAGLDGMEVQSGGAGATGNDGGAAASGGVGGKGGTGGDTSGGGGTGTGAGGSGGCSLPTDCPDPVEPCRHATCDGGECGIELDPLGTDCDDNGGDECNGLGACLSSDGRPCAQNGHCVSAHCVDDVCCESACDGTCETCDGAVPGTCVPAAAGSSEGGECAPEGLCDGTRACASGDTLWSKAFGDNAAQWAAAVATDSTGNVLLAGVLAGTADFGGGTLTANGDDLFAAKLDPNGGHVWSRVATAANNQQANAVAALSNGDLVATGYFENTLTLDGHTITSGGNKSVFVARLAAATGMATWLPELTESNAEQQGLAIAVAADDGVLVAGKYKGTLDFGNGVALPDAAGRFYAFVVRFGPTGDAVWGKGFGNSAADTVGHAVAVDGSGNVWIAGEFAGTTDFGGGSHTAGGTDVFVVKLDASGAHLWSGAFGDAANQRATGIAAHDGEVVVVGNFRGNLDFGVGLLAAGGHDDVFVAKLAANGSAVWSARYGDAALDQFAYGVACSSSGMIAVTGAFRGTMTLGTLVVSSANLGKDDVFVAKLASDGTPLWAHRYGNGAQDQAGYGGAIDADEQVLLVGMINAPVDFGDGAIGGWGSGDIFAAKLGR